jgi:hypothetical protein
MAGLAAAAPAPPPRAPGPLGPPSAPPAAAPCPSSAARRRLGHPRPCPWPVQPPLFIYFILFSFLLLLLFILGKLIIIHVNEIGNLI